MRTWDSRIPSLVLIMLTLFLSAIFGLPQTHFFGVKEETCSSERGLFLHFFLVWGSLQPSSPLLIRPASAQKVSLFVFSMWRRRLTVEISRLLSVSHSISVYLSVSISVLAPSSHWNESKFLHLSCSLWPLWYGKYVCQYFSHVSFLLDMRPKFIFTN